MGFVCYAGLYRSAMSVKSMTNIIKRNSITRGELSSSLHTEQIWGGYHNGATTKTSDLLIEERGALAIFFAKQGRQRTRRPLSSGCSEIREGVKTLTKRQGECSSSSGGKCGRKGAKNKYINK